MKNESDPHEISRFAAVAPDSGTRPARRPQPFRVGQATTAHLFAEASTASFWKGVEDLSALGFRVTDADNMLAHLSDTYGDRTQEFRDRMAKCRMQFPALYHVLAVNDASRRRENIEEGMRVGKFIHEVGGGIFNLAGGERLPEGTPFETARKQQRYALEKLRLQIA